MIVIGLLVVAVGVLARFGLLSWFGNLPGDLRFGGERTSGFIPLTSMLIVSAILTLAINIVGRFLDN